MSKLHEPIAGFKPFAYPQGDVSQFFGENPQLYAKFNLAGHNGWDIVRAYGTPIMCVESGKVVEVSYNPAGNGKLIRILCEDNVWAYGHLSEISVVQGQQVQAGDVIGNMGNTGFVVSGATPFWKGGNPYAGTHLHLGRKRIQLYTNQPSWNESYPTGDRAILLDPIDNGYFGASDFSVNDFDGQADTSTLNPSDRVALIAAQKTAAGDTKTANMLFAIVQVLKAWGK